MRILLWICLLLSFGCREKETQAPDEGKVSNNRYTNSFFNFSIELPIEWDVQNRTETKQIQEAGKEELRSANEKLAAEIDSVEAGIQQLLTVFKFEADTTSTFNPSLVIMSERLPDVAESFDERSYLSLTRNQLATTGLYSKIDDQIISQKIGGRDFYILRVTSEHEKEITQEFYTNLAKGYAFIVIISYSTREERNELKQILSTMKFG